MQQLFDPELFEFYDIKSCLLDPESISVFLYNFDFEELIDIIVCLHTNFPEYKQQVFNKVFADIIEETVIVFLLDVNAENFDDDIDIYEIIEEATTYDEYGAHINNILATSSLEQRVEDAARDYVLEILSQLPEDVFFSLDQEEINLAKVEVYGASGIITAHIDYVDDKYEPTRETAYYGQYYEITSIFDRDICQ